MHVGFIQHYAVLFLIDLQSQSIVWYVVMFKPNAFHGCDALQCCNYSMSYSFRLLSPAALHTPTSCCTAHILLVCIMRYYVSVASILSLVNQVSCDQNIGLDGTLTVG